MLDGVAQWLGIQKSAAVGGALGAIISLRFAQKLSIVGKFSMFFSGMLLATYTTPLAAKYFSVGLDLYGGIGLVIGIFGMAVVSALMTAISGAWDVVKDALKEWLKSKLGK